MKHLLLITCILVSKLISGQSTLFVDSLKITADNNVIYQTTETKIFFLPNDKKTNTTIFSDGLYKFVNTPLGFRLFKKDSVIGLTYVCYDCDSYEECDGIQKERPILRNWFHNDSIPKNKTIVEISYRLFDFVPIDTTNYRKNYRDGEWVTSKTWLSRSGHIKQIRVNYKNDKKDGIAKVVYDDGVTLNVNFKDNIADNYGLGYFENWKDRNKIRSSYEIPRIVTKSCEPTKPYESFSFFNGKKEKEVRKHQDLSVHSQKTGLKNDSVEYHVKGEFMGIENDSMIIQAEEKEIHNFYRRDSLHAYTVKVPSRFVKVPLGDLTKIYYTREKWKTFTLRSALVSLASALVVAPLVSIQKGGFNTERFAKVSGTSFGVMVLSISFGIAFSQKEFLLMPTKKSNKVWTIKPNVD
jgi:hypothetical protein